MLMLMPPYHGAGLRADETGTFEHFARVAEAAPSLPIMVQDAPLERRHPVGAVPGPAGPRGAAGRATSRSRCRARPPSCGALIAAGGEAIAGPFDGEEGITLMADLDAGATGTMPSALLPDLIKPVLEHHRAGRRAEAAAAYARILPLINYENRQCGLRATKVVMAAGGVIASEAVRHPLEPLHRRRHARDFCSSLAHSSRSPRAGANEGAQLFLNRPKQGGSRDKCARRLSVPCGPRRVRKRRRQRYWRCDGCRLRPAKGQGCLHRYR